MGLEDGVAFLEDMDGLGDFCGEVGADVGEEIEDGLLMERESEAGGPTGTIRDPNSTPIVTSWWGEKRPSQRRIVSLEGVSRFRNSKG